ncbi:hypothetical protein C4D60_Mb10t13830 [Musa balbisiana]|uniref:Uncharacterized protein n=1 Tax=Musa balbisiana TaxID=52838 RepID=A0A4S8IYB8_MUSBA|nr:hypothetical protein C4D60_Mb10t13830 [Musa balbisiana]
MEGSLFRGAEDRGIIVLSTCHQEFHIAHADQRFKKALGRSPKRSGEVRRGPSASLIFQAACFKEAPPGRSPEPKCWALRASAWVNQHDQTRILGLVGSWFGLRWLVGSIEPTKTNISDNPTLTLVAAIAPDPNPVAHRYRCSQTKATKPSHYLMH